MKSKYVNIGSAKSKGAKVIAIVQCTGIWIAGGMFGCSWKAIGMRLKPRAQISGIKAFAKIQEDLIDDDEEEYSADDVKREAPAFGNPVVSEDEDEDEDVVTAVQEDVAVEEDTAVEEEEEEEVPVVRPKKRVVKRKV